MRETLREIQHGALAVEDHPRVCGKHVVDGLTLSLTVGSPPRMRETLEWLARITLDKRITPAYAGNTNTAIHKKVTLEDHPRVCGKHINRKVKTRLKWGSPPRMRETRFFNERTVRTTWDHPRVCGKHRLPLRKILGVLGSPPRMRETPNCKRKAGNA